jgi:2-polyprenyl-3-methyl-5-hydroxy-6-metoxy-1,4-benzoquinol methylase
MSSIKDERGFNQIFIETKASIIRKERRCDYMIDKMNINTVENQITILEIGCGTGEGLKYIANKTNSKCYGIDLSSKFIEQAKANNQQSNVNYLVGDFNDAAFISADISTIQFDFIIGNGILHHLYYSIDESLKNIRNLLKPNGKIIFIEPNIYNPYIAFIFQIPYLRKKTFLEPDEMAFSRRFIKKKLNDNLYSSNSIEIRDFLLPNIPEKLINTTIKIGSILEKTPLTLIAQSLFITANK